MPALLLSVTKLHCPVVVVAITIWRVAPAAERVTGNLEFLRQDTVGSCFRLPISGNRKGEGSLGKDRKMAEEES